MNDVAELGIRINSEQAKRAVEDLRRLEQIGRRAGDMADLLHGRTNTANRSLAEMERAAAKAGQALGRIIGLSVSGTLTAFGYGLVKVKDQILDLAKVAEDNRLRPEILSGLFTAARGAGASESEITRALSKFSEASKKARDDAENFYKAMDNIDPSLARAFQNSRTQEERLRLISEAIKSTSDEVKRAQLAMEAFGTDSERVLRVLGVGQEGLSEFERSAKALGLAIDHDMIAKARQADQVLARLSNVISSNLRAALVDLAPIIAYAAAQLGPLVEEAGRIISIITGSQGWSTSSVLRRRAQALDEALSPLEAEVARREKAASQPGGLSIDYELERLRRTRRELYAERQKVEAELAARGEYGDPRDLRAQASEAFRRSGGLAAAPPAFRERPSLSPAESSFDRTLRLLREQSELQRSVRDTLDAEVEQREYLLMKQRMMNIAARDGVDLSEEQKRKIDEGARAYGRMAAEIEKARLRLGVLFDRATMFLPETERQIAHAMRGLHGQNWASHMNGPEASMMRFNARLKEARDLSAEFASGFARDMLAGKNATEAATNALRNFLTRLIDRGLDNIVNAIFGGIANGNRQGAGGGVFGLLFGGGAGIAANNNVAGAAAAQMQVQVGTAIQQSLAPALTGGIEAAAAAIRRIESGSFAGNYSALGPITRTGDRAYGAYQVMGANIPEWTRRHWGEALTPEQFLSSREAQDTVFRSQFGSYMQKYGLEGAARAWFAGPGGMNRFNAADINGTQVGRYGQMFNHFYGQAGGQPMALQGAIQAQQELAAAQQQTLATTQQTTSAMQGLSASQQMAGTAAMQAAPQVNAAGQAMQQAGMAAGQGAQAAAAGAAQLNGLMSFGAGMAMPGARFNPMSLFGLLGPLGGLFGGGGAPALSPFGRFDRGGFTGHGAVYDPAGIVHKGEIVWSQADIRRAGGVAVVEGMRLGLRGYADGGLVGASRFGGVNDNRPVNVTIGGTSITVHGSVGPDELAEIKREIAASERRQAAALREVVRNEPKRRRQYDLRVG